MRKLLAEYTGLTIFNVLKYFLGGAVQRKLFPPAITLIGMPAEVYTQGTQLLAMVLALPVLCLVTGWVYMPVFHNLQLVSSYE